MAAPHYRRSRRYRRTTVADEPRAAAVAGVGGANKWQPPIAAGQLFSASGAAGNAGVGGAGGQGVTAEPAGPAPPRASSSAPAERPVTPVSAGPAAKA